MPRFAAKETKMAGDKITKTQQLRGDLRWLADLVHREIEAGATSVEEIHKAIACMPLDVFEKTAKDARKIRETSIGAVYDLIRKVNDEVAKLAKEMLDGRAAILAHKRVRPAPEAKKVALRPATHAVRISSHT